VRMFRVDRLSIPEIVARRLNADARSRQVLALNKPSGRTKGWFKPTVRRILHDAGVTK